MIIEAKQINKWIERSFTNAVKHGWHEEEKPTTHWLLMIITEVAEAVQADRKDRWMDDLDKGGLECALANDHHGGLVEDFYERNIEGKVESELADICIRMFDFMGVLGAEADTDIDISSVISSIIEKGIFTEIAFNLIDKIIALGNLTSDELMIIHCVGILEFVFEWAEALNIDLVQHINLKMRYNESREYHHGGKKY